MSSRSRFGTLTALPLEFQARCGLRDLRACGHFGNVRTHCYLRHRLESAIYLLHRSHFAFESIAIFHRCSQTLATCCTWAGTTIRSHFRTYYSKSHSGVTELGSLSLCSTRAHLMHGLARGVGEHSGRAQGAQCAGLLVVSSNIVPWLQRQEYTVCYMNGLVVLGTSSMFLNKSFCWIMFLRTSSMFWKSYDV